VFGRFVSFFLALLIFFLGEDANFFVQVAAAGEGEWVAVQD
jgi:hypothetical protein